MKCRNKRNVFFVIFNEFCKKNRINKDDIIEVWYKDLPHGFRGYKMYLETYSDGVYRSYYLKG